MLGNLKTYWEEVDVATRTKEGFLALLMSTDEYNSKSATGKESYLQNAEDLWDAFYNSTVDTATFSDEHDVLTTLNSMQDWTFKVNLSNPEQLALAMGYSNYAISTPQTSYYYTSFPSKRKAGTNLCQPLKILWIKIYPV